MSTVLARLAAIVQAVGDVNPTRGCRDMLFHGGTVAPQGGVVNKLSYTTPPRSQRTGRRMTDGNVRRPRTTRRYRSSHRGHQSDPLLPRYARPRGYGGAQGGVVSKLIYDTARISAQKAPIDVKPSALCSYGPQQSYKPTEAKTHPVVAELWSKKGAQRLSLIHI